LYDASALILFAPKGLSFAAPAPSPELDTSLAAAEKCSVYPLSSAGINAKVSGRLFEIDGKTQYFAGTNAWWLAHLSENSDVDLALAQIASTGYKTIRVWGFGDVNTPPAATATDPNAVYFQLLNSSGSYINYSPNGLQRLDYVVSSASRYNLKLILNFVNNWSDYGGIAAYNTAFGGNATTWFTDAKSQQVYRDYIRVVVERYKASTAIFAWELANEPRCHGCATDVITNWASGIAGYVKTLDNEHLVTLGDEGWLDGGGDGSYAYSGIEGVDFQVNLGVKGLDYGVFHLYPDSWGYNDTWGSEWITQHDAVGAVVGKPVILEEYGTPFPGNHTSTEGPWQEAVLKSGLAADSIWQFGPYGTIVSPDSVSDVNTIFYNSSEYQVLGRLHAANMLRKIPGF